MVYTNIYSLNRTLSYLSAISLINSFKSIIVEIAFKIYSIKNCWNFSIENWYILTYLCVVVVVVVTDVILQIQR